MGERKEYAKGHNVGRTEDADYPDNLCISHTHTHNTRTHTHTHTHTGDSQSNLCDLPTMKTNKMLLMTTLNTHGVTIMTANECFTH